MLGLLKFIFCNDETLCCMYSIKVINWLKILYNKLKAVPMKMNVLVHF